MYFAQFNPLPFVRPPMGPPLIGPPPIEMPPFGPPPMGIPPFGPPPSDPSQIGPPPMGPPPNFSPQSPMWQVAPHNIRSCLFRHTYVWLDNGRSFWFYPMLVTRNMVTGYRWSNRNGWRFRSIQLNNIRSFQCF